MARLGRVYDAPTGDDGTRVLVDRLWPRGLRKDAAQIDEWLKEIAPSTELRKWYGHRPEAFSEFTSRYLAELADPERTRSLDRLRELAAAGPLTVLTASKRADISQAAVLVGLLDRS